MPVLLSSVGEDQIKERVPECGACGLCPYCERLGQGPTARRMWSEGCSYYLKFPSLVIPLKGLALAVGG